MWSEISNLICCWHLFKSTTAAILKCIFKKDMFFFHTCPLYSELQSNLGNMVAGVLVNELISARTMVDIRVKLVKHFLKGVSVRVTDPGIFAGSGYLKTSLIQLSGRFIPDQITKFVCIDVF